MKCRQRNKAEELSEGLSTGDRTEATGNLLFHPGTANSLISDIVGIGNAPIPGEPQANIIVSTLCPLLERALTDQGLAALSLTNTMYYVTAITIVLLSSKLIEYLTVSLESNLQKSITQKCKSNVINHAFKLKMTCYNEYGFYKQLADALSDTDRLLSFSESCIIAIVGNFVKILGAFIALISINWRLLLLVIAFIPIKILVASHHQIMLGLQCDKTIEAAKSFGNWVNRSAMSINDSKLWNMHNYVCKKGEEKINTLTRGAIRKEGA